jgi:putative spermidine/putrescine transport system substrate-binding protein
VNCKSNNAWRALPLALIVLLAACATPPPADAGITGTPTSPQSGASSMSTLIAAAQREGTLNVIALPRDWANYGEMIDTFKRRYNINVNEMSPDASSVEELEALRSARNYPTPQAPDVIDVGFIFGESAKADGLIQPYKVAEWESIPDNLKDTEGHWYGGYYGVLVFEVNRNLINSVPQDWADLLKPEYKGKVALAGDPRRSAQAINAVFAASLASGGSLDAAEPGLRFFDQLNKAGNFVPVIAKPATLASGETPITIRWDYNALPNRDASGSNPTIEVVVPKSGVLAGTYVQAISAYAPHPNAARLWMEFLFSDEGQLIWLKGYAHPIRFADLVKRKLVPEDLLKRFPDPALYERAAYPTNAQLESSKRTITEGWDRVVGVDVR